jgi:hypothetical protein
MAGLSSWVAHTLRGAPRAMPPKSPELLILGSGCRSPFQVTVGTVLALDSCGLIYNNQGTRYDVPDFLLLFDVPFRTISYGSRHDAEGAPEVISGFRRAKRVAMLTSGNPQVLGEFATSLRAGCVRGGVSWRFVESTSFMDLLPALPDVPRHDSGALQVRVGADVAPILPSAAVLLYEPFSHGPAGLRELARACGKSRPAFVFHSRGSDESVLKTRVGELAASGKSVGLWSIVYIPPA